MPNFSSDLKQKLDYYEPKTYAHFEEIFKDTLDLHAPIKSKIIRGNEKPHLTKEIRKEMMIRTKLKNKYKKTRDPKDYDAYKIKRNYVKKLNDLTKKQYFQRECPLKMTTKKDPINIFIFRK